MAKLITTEDIYGLKDYLGNKIGHPVTYLNHGATSVVFVDKDRAIVCTVDPIKIDYVNLVLSTQLPVGHIYGWSRNHPHYPEFMIYTMPVLFPISKEQYQELLPQINHLRSRYNRRFDGQEANKIHAKFEVDGGTYESYVLGPLVDFLAMCEPSEVCLDLGQENIMQNKEGRVFLTDPIVSSDVLSLL